MMPLPLPADERALLDRAHDWPAFPRWQDLTEELLRQLAAEHGIDFATALLYDRLVCSPEYGPFLAGLHALTEQAPPARLLNATLVVVPGAFHVEFPHTGADGRLLREEAERFGCRTELVPLASLGSLAQNARALRDHLLTTDGPVILASLSKGGADVKRALAEPDAGETFRNVIVWVNLCGLVHGTPLVDWVRARRLRTWWYRGLFWLRGFDFAAAAELARGPGTPLDFALRLPPALHAIHLVGFPLRRHLSNALARRCHRRLRPLGPNDGAGILLADVGRLPGLLYPVWGADHYLRPGGRELRGLARRLLHYLSREWDRLVEGSLQPVAALPGSSQG